MARILLHENALKMSSVGSALSHGRIGRKLEGAADLGPLSWRQTEEEIFSQYNLLKFDGPNWTARMVDIALPLYYHCIHHRDQMQILIRQQGLEPDFIDHVGIKYQRIS